MSDAPTAMKIPRMMRAIAMPIRSTFCWYILGTAKAVMMSRKTKTLSTDSAFSVRYPAKYSPPNCHPDTTPMPTPKISASVM